MFVIKIDERSVIECLFLAHVYANVRPSLVKYSSSVSATSFLSASDRIALKSLPPFCQIKPIGAPFSGSSGASPVHTAASRLLCNRVYSPPTLVSEVKEGSVEKLVT